MPRGLREPGPGRSFQGRSAIRDFRVFLGGRNDPPTSEAAFLSLGPGACWAFLANKCNGEVQSRLRSFGTGRRCALCFSVDCVQRGDGFIANKTLKVPFYATSISGPLPYGVQTLLLRFGIVSRIHHKRFLYRGGISPTAFAVHVLGEDSAETFLVRLALATPSEERMLWQCCAVPSAR